VLRGEHGLHEGADIVRGVQGCLGMVAAPPPPEGKYGLACLECGGGGEVACCEVSRTQRESQCCLAWSLLQLLCWLQLHQLARGCLVSMTDTPCACAAAHLACLLCRSLAVVC
jgi:hypothetical protein